MRQLKIAPLLFVLAFGAGFTGCGGDSADDLAAQQEKLNQREARMDELKQLQKKENTGTLTPEERARLDEIYAELESEGENPENAG
jgi:hypothetical protein